MICSLRRELKKYLILDPFLHNKLWKNKPEVINLQRSFESVKYNGENVVNTLAPSFLMGSSSYLQVTRTCIISWTGLKFSQIRPRTAELAAFERLEKSP